MSVAQAAEVTENGVLPVAQEEATGFKVFVGNLAYSTTEEGLKTFFEAVQSDIISVQVIKRGPRPAGYGFVAMSSAEAVQSAIETLSGKELDGREVLIEIAKPVDQKNIERARRRIGRRGGKPVPGEVTDAEANGDVKTDDAAAAAPGDGEGAQPKKKKKKYPRKPKRKDTEIVKDATAVQESATEDAPAPAPAEAEAEVEAAAPAPKYHQRRRFYRPRPRRPVGEDPVGEPSKTMLFVANLGFDMDDAALTALFTDASVEVISARIVRRRWGRPRRSKGYGFVDVGSEEAQQKAINALQGKEVEGRTIAVKIAVNTIRAEEAEATS